MTEGRINGSLNLSRALGDMDYKQSKDLGPSAQVRPKQSSTSALAHVHASYRKCASLLEL